MGDVWGGHVGLRSGSDRNRRLARLQMTARLEHRSSAAPQWYVRQQAIHAPQAAGHTHAEVLHPLDRRAGFLIQPGNSGSAVDPAWRTEGARGRAQRGSTPHL